MFIYLVVSGLSCSMKDLPCVMWDPSLPCKDSLVVACLWLTCSTVCGILVSQLESVNTAALEKKPIISTL